MLLLFVLVASTSGARPSLLASRVPSRVPSRSTGSLRPRGASIAIPCVHGLAAAKRSAPQMLSPPMFFPEALKQCIGWLTKRTLDFAATSTWCRLGSASCCFVLLLLRVDGGVSKLNRGNTELQGKLLKVSTSVVDGRVL
ncbi:hypothetical protein T492DRAFT_1115722 [Pavlovales sp. CCMP2436]|nr:hypothetical protein T492DRAFT_1115722 [Pavlovales sp. CCMP2436]